MKDNKLQAPYEYIWKLLETSGYEFSKSDNKNARIYNLLYSEICNLGVAIARGHGKKLYFYFITKLKDDLDKINAKKCDDSSATAQSSENNVSNGDKKSDVSNQQTDLYNNRQQMQNDSAKIIRSDLLDKVFQEAGINGELEKFSRFHKQKALNYLKSLKRVILCFDNGKSEEGGHGDEDRA